MMILEFWNGLGFKYFVSPKWAGLQMFRFSATARGLIKGDIWTLFKTMLVLSEGFSHKQHSMLPFIFSVAFKCKILLLLFAFNTWWCNLKINRMAIQEQRSMNCIGGSNEDTPKCAQRELKDETFPNHLESSTCKILFFLSVQTKVKIDSNKKRA